MRIEHHQPRLIPPPIPESQERPSTRNMEWMSRSRSLASRTSSRGSFSVRRKLNAYNGPRRPRIGQPTDFRHVNIAMPRRKEGFRPLELSIYMPENQLSPILPHFGAIDDMSFPAHDLKDLPFPPAAFTHSRSESALSFRIPRKPVRTDSASSEWTANLHPKPDSLNTQELLAALDKELPKPPPQARLRAMTEPPAYERVKSALHEKFELERRLKDIDEMIEERRSIYLQSRHSSRAASLSGGVFEESQGMFSGTTFEKYFLIHYRTNAPSKVFICSTCSPASCRSTSKECAIKDGPHSRSHEVLHRSFSNFQFSPSKSTQFRSSATTSTSGSSGFPPTFTKEKVFLKNLKLALSRE
jgi:hypothetical protein